LKSAGLSRPVTGLIQGVAKGKPIEAFTDLPRNIAESAFTTRNPFTGAEWVTGIGQELVRDVEGWLGSAERMGQRNPNLASPFGQR
jgi:hypothetical protein